MKMKITVEVENADGLKEIKPIVIDTEIPEFEEFKIPDNFREVFDNYEKAVLKARNRAAELTTQEYLYDPLSAGALRKPNSLIIPRNYLDQ